MKHFNGELFPEKYENAAPTTFTVVIPLHNKKPHVARALRSALEQSYPALEILVIDDASDDGGMEEITGFSDTRIRTFHRVEPGPGGYAARNMGIENAKGEWIAFLDADDQWRPNHLQALALAIQGAPNPPALSCAFSGYENVRADGTRSLDPHTSRFHLETAHYYDFDGFLRAWIEIGDCPMWTSASAVRRSVLVDEGMFPAGRCARGGDKDMWLRAARNRMVAAAPSLTSEFHHATVNKVTHRTATNTRHCLCPTIEKMLSDGPPHRAALLKKLFNLEVFQYAKQTARSARVPFKAWKGFHATSDARKYVILTLLSLPLVSRVARTLGFIARAEKTSFSNAKKREPIDVLLVVTRRNKAGAQLVAILVARELRRRGYKVTTCFLYDVLPSFENEDDTISLASSAPRGVIQYLRILRGLYRTLKVLRPSAVHTILPFANVVTAPLAFLVGVPCRVASLHYPAETQNRALKVVDSLWGAIGLYTGVVAVSQFVEASLARYPSRYRRQVTVIPNGMPERLPTLDRVGARRRFGIPESAFVLGNVGRLSQQKNQMFLIEIAKHIPDAVFVVAGEGEERQNLQARIEEYAIGDRVKLIGNISEDDIPNFLACIDIFILTSHYEGLPLSVIEAMQAGVPILASDIPAVREAVSSGTNVVAVLAPLTSVEPWVAAARAIQSGRIDTEDLTHRARLRADAFRVAPMVDSYERLLLKGRRQAAAPVPTG